MNAFEKIDFLKKAEEENVKARYASPYLLDIRYRTNKWQPREIEALWEKYPWLPEYYKEFLKRYDSLGLSWFRFYGSKETNVNPVESELEWWKEKIGKKYFPFGDGVGGDIFIFNQKGEVWMIEYGDFDWENPKKVADTLEEFIGQVLLGNRFGEFDSKEDNKFYDFLKDQGWAE